MTATEKVYLQRFIMGPPDDMRVTMLSLDKLDCRRANLRICSRAAQYANMPIDDTNTSGYKGVAQTGGKYEARIWNEGKREFLGRFATVEEAARAYDARARELFGELARHNFPRDGERPARLDGYK